MMGILNLGMGEVLNERLKLTGSATVEAPLRKMFELVLSHRGVNSHT
jgi:hypothetical protein